jgi:dephospho-CoA kinase
MRVAIAGYMGAGKTTRARTFESAGAYIIDADAEAKLLMSRDYQIQDELRNAFGDAATHPTLLGQAAFQSTDSLKTLNRIVHPPLIQHIKRLISDCQAPSCILDAALTPLWGIEPWFDKCVWINTPFDVRFERLKAKRGDISEEEIIRRMKLQEEIMPEPDFRKWVCVKPKD